MRGLVSVIAIICALPSAADTVVPVRTIRAQEVIGHSDLKLRGTEVSGSFSRIEEVAGLEARVALYPGRPVRLTDVGPPALVERNQVVELTYRRGGLTLRTDARALERGGVGEFVKVMNLASRNIVDGRVRSDGSVSVSDQEGLH